MEEREKTFIVSTIDVQSTMTTSPFLRLRMI